MTMLLKDGNKTMDIDNGLLQRRWGLPSNATETEIKAAIASRAPLSDAAVRASQPAPRPSAGPLLTAAARVQAAADAEHDQFMAARFPTDRRRLQGDLTVHHIHGS